MCFVFFPPFFAVDFFPRQLDALLKFKKKKKHTDYTCGTCFGHLAPVLVKRGEINLVMKVKQLKLSEEIMQN